MTALVVRMPLWVRKAIVDFATVFCGAIVVLTIAAPDGGNWRDWLLVIAAAVVNVALNALRRAAVTELPDALAWLAEILQTAPTKP